MLGWYPAWRGVARDCACTSPCAASLFPGPPTDAPESSERFLAAVDMAREDFLQQYTDCLTFFPIMYGGENSGRAATGRSCLPPPLRLRPGSTLRPLLADERPTAHVPQSAGQGGRDAAVPLSSGRTLAQNITIAMAASQRHETGASSGGPAEAEPRVAFTLDTDLPRKRHPGAVRPHASPCDVQPTMPEVPSPVNCHPKRRQ